MFIRKDTYDVIYYVCCGGELIDYVRSMSKRYKISYEMCLCMIAYEII